MVKVRDVSGCAQKIIDGEANCELMIIDGFVEDAGVMGVLCEVMCEEERGEVIIPKVGALDEVI